MASTTPTADGAPRFAFFVSSHGYGHAARTAALVAALDERLPGCRSTLFTTVAPWFFEDSLGRRLDVEPLAPDIGLVQTDALTEDLPATLERLTARIPYRDAELDAVAARLAELAPDLVICDIAPLGIAAARRAGLPSLLIENFTWDFIYRGFVERCPGLAAVADALEAIFARADYRVQAEPFCVPVAGARRVAPVARAPRQGRAAMRRRLGVPDGGALVLMTMGGAGWSYDDLAAGLGGAENLWLAIPGGAETERRDGRVIRLPHHSSYYHPDLIHAADAAVGKLGYSTVAEVASAGVPLGYFRRQGFPESAVLEAWVERHLDCRSIEVSDLADGRWLDTARDLVRRPRRAPYGGGAAQIAGHVAEIVARSRLAAT